MLYKTLSAAVYGIEASIIEVEVEVSGIKTMEDHFIPSVCPMPPSVRVGIAYARRSRTAVTTSLPPTSRSTLLRRIFTKRVPASTCLWPSEWTRMEV
jgi:hypothetical protein